MHEAEIRKFEIEKFLGVAFFIEGTKIGREGCEIGVFIWDYLAT